ncbi:hypothetical protein HWV62_27661 [Athelia sp. TMB]|nr:hypothetical protein HWV62_27661 [Athelia sp. TMB]
MADGDSEDIYENVWRTTGKGDRDVLAQAPPENIEEHAPESQSLLRGESDARHQNGQGPRPPAARTFLIRALALLCACSLSVGSHYASYILGPLKSRLSRELGTSNTEFSLLISAFALNSTWTPLVGGLLVSKLGTTKTSIFATGAIFIGVEISTKLMLASPGQVLLLSGEVTEDIRLMTFGLFVFGLGVSPLAVVQETIIVRFFRSHGLGISMALGLVAGKGASFVSARTSYPLSERYGRHAPFYVATFLAGLSVAVNLVYISASKWLIQSTGTQLEASEIEQQLAKDPNITLTEAQALEKVASKRRVKLGDVRKLDGIFWAYIGLNVLCGTIWAPFTHLAAYVSSLPVQTLAGLALDTKHASPNGKAGLNIQRLINAWVVLAALHFCMLLALGELDRRRKAANVLLAVNARLRSPVEILTEDLDEVHSEASVHSDYGTEGSVHQHGTPREAPHPSSSLPDQRLSLLIPEPMIARSQSPVQSKRMRQGDIYAVLCFMLIVFAWVLFLATAWVRLRSKAERGGTA